MSLEEVGRLNSGWGGVVASEAGRWFGRSSAGWEVLGLVSLLMYPEDLEPSIALS